MRLLVHLLRIESPAIVSDGENDIPRTGYFSGGRQLLFLSSKKDYEAFRHARAFWPIIGEKYVFSFSGNVQLIQPSWIKEMFPDEQAIKKWIYMGVKNRIPTASVLKAYSQWAWAAKRKSVVLYPLEK